MGLGIVQCALVPVVELLNVLPPPDRPLARGREARVSPVGSSTSYGWFRDEFYYIACGEHLDWGYVDHPPLVALVTATTRAVLGDSIVAIRLPAALAGPATVIVTGLLAYELGAGRFGQGLAALAVLVATIYLPLQHILSMNAWEPLWCRAWRCSSFEGSIGEACATRAFASVLAGVGFKQAQHAVLRVRAARRPRAVAGEADAVDARPMDDRNSSPPVISCPTSCGGAARVAHAGVPPARPYIQTSRSPLAFVGQQALVMNPVNAVVWGERPWWFPLPHADGGSWVGLPRLARPVHRHRWKTITSPYDSDALCGGRRRHERWTAVTTWQPLLRMTLPALMLLVRVAAAPLAVPILP